MDLHRFFKANKKARPKPCFFQFKNYEEKKLSPIHLLLIIPHKF